MKKLLSALLAIISVFTFVFFAAGSGKKEEVETTIPDITEEFTVDEITTYYEDDYYYTEPSEEWYDEETEVYPGEKVWTDEVEVTYNDWGVLSEYDSFLGPEEGNGVIFLDLTFNNIGDEDYTVTYFDFACDIGSVYYFAEDGLSTVSLRPGQSESGRIYFEIPETADIANITLYMDALKTQKVIFVVQ